MSAAAPHPDLPSADDRRRLLLMAAVSLVVFALEVLGGDLAGSQAVQADALDFAATGFATLGALRTGPRRAGAALATAALLAGLAGWIAVATLYRCFVQDVPEPSLMAALGVVALAGNGAILHLLRAGRNGAALGAFWLRARNDGIGNATLVIAAGVGALLHNSVADLTVAGVMIVLASTTIGPELRDAWRAWKAVQVPAPAGSERR